MAHWYLKEITKCNSVLFLKKNCQWQVTFGLLLISVFLVLSTQQAHSSSTQHDLQPVIDLSRDGGQSRDKSLVLLLEFSSEYCPFCELLEEEFLYPMQKNAGYREKVLIRTARLDENDTIIGFDGKPTSIDELAERYDVAVTPTMVFLDAEGNQLSEPLIGIWSIDFYGSYLDARIDEAREKLL